MKAYRLVIGLEKCQENKDSHTFIARGFSSKCVKSGFRLAPHCCTTAKYSVSAKFHHTRYFALEVYIERWENFFTLACRVCAFIVRSALPCTFYSFIMGSLAIVIFQFSTLLLEIVTEKGCHTFIISST